LKAYISSIDHEMKMEKWNLLEDYDMNDDDDENDYEDDINRILYS